MENQIILQKQNQLTTKLIKCLVNANPGQSNIDLVIFEKDLTLQKAMTGSTLFSLEKQTETKNIIKTLVYLITKAKDSFNVKSTLNENQILTLSVDLLEMYKYETIEDIVMMLKMARQGKIGSKLYYLDSTIILNEWMPEYLELKAREREESHAKNKSNDTELNDVQLKALDQYNEKKKAQGEEKQEEFQLMSNDSYGNWIKHLPETCKHLTLHELKVQIKRAKNTTDKKPFEIYTNEYENRINK